MKKILSILFLLTAVFFISCSASNSVKGSWELTRTLKTEFGDGENAESLGFFYTKQIIRYEFRAGGNYTKTVVQSFDKVEFQKKTPHEDYIKEQLSGLNSKTVIIGKYSEHSNILTLIPSMIRVDDFPVMSADEYLEKNPTFQIKEDISFRRESEILYLQDEFVSYAEYRPATPRHE